MLVRGQFVRDLVLGVGAGCIIAVCLFLGSLSYKGLIVRFCAPGEPAKRITVGPM